jgi:hypothetical protein
MEIQSVYQDDSCAVAFNNISHLEFPNGENGGVIVITKQSYWDFEKDFWGSNLFIYERNRRLFLAQWYDYQNKMQNLNQLSHNKKRGE